MQKRNQTWKGIVITTECHRKACKVKFDNDGIFDIRDIVSCAVDIVLGDPELKAKLIKKLVDGNGVSQL